MVQKTKLPFFAKELTKKEQELILARQDPFAEDDEEEFGNYIYKPFKRRLTQATPGYVLRLDYVNAKDLKFSTRTVLVTATERGPMGNFISTRDNTLVCCFDLNPNSYTFKLVLKLFYRKENRCNYKLIPSFLKFIFGLNAFKTLNIENASRVYTVLKKKNVQ